MAEAAFHFFEYQKIGSEWRRIRALALYRRRGGHMFFFWAWACRSPSLAP